MTINFLLKTSKKSSSALSRLYLRVRDGRLADVTLRLPIIIPLALWDPIRQRLRSKRTCDDFSYTINEQLLSLRLSLLQSYNSSLRYSFPDFRISRQWLTLRLSEFFCKDSSSIASAAPASASPAPSTASCREFSSYFDEYSVRHSVSAVRLRNNQVLKRAIMRFEIYQRITVSPGYLFDISSVSSSTLSDLWTYLATEHILYTTHPSLFRSVKESRPLKPRGQNAIIDLFCRLRAFFNWCLSAGYITSTPFNSFTIPSPVYGTPIYITDSELSLIAHTDLSYNQFLSEQRDIFVFQCCVGCRVGDLYRMNYNNVQDGIFSYIAGKTKDNNPRTLSIPLVGIARLILQRHYNPSRKSILPFVSEPRYNKAIKEVFRICGLNRNVTVLDPATRTEVRKPLWKCASSHMARRTFCGNLYKNVKDPSIVASMSGHKEGSAAFARYRSIDMDIKVDALGVFSSL